jgi:lipopolysaccharide biosynthesis regulator YciM
MIETVVYLLMSIGLVLIVYVIVSSLVTRRKGKVAFDPNYVSALEALIRSEEESAKRYLIDSARANPSSLSPFLVLGDIFRRGGELEKAVKIHRELSIRPNLAKEEIEKVYMSLAHDYLEVGRYDRAVGIAKKLLALKKRDIPSLELLLKGYEGMESWDNAIDTARTISGFVPSDGTKYLGRYHAYVGWKISKTDPERAEGLFKKALSLYPACTSASVLMGDLFFRQGAYGKAIRVWDEMLNRDPKTIHYVADRLERAYYESGKYSQMMEVYERLHHRIPGDVLVLLGLARMSLKKGDSASATRYAREAKEIDPADQRIYRVFLEIYEESHDPKPALEACQDFFSKVFSGRTKYHCRRCNFRSESIFVRCPECDGWDVEVES